MSLYSLIEDPKAFLLATAMYPQKNPSLFYRVKNVINLTLATLIVSCMTFNAVYYYDNLIRLSESLFLDITVVASLIKLVLLLVKKDTFLKLVDSFNNFSFTNNIRLYGSCFLEEYLKALKIIIVFYKVQVVATLIGMALCPEHKPLPIDFPYFVNGTFHYPFYVFEMVAICLAASDKMSMDLLTIGIISIAGVQLRILNQKLADTHKNVAKYKGYSKKEMDKHTMLYLYECCTHYIHIEEFIKEIVEVFSVSFFVQLLGSCIAICNSGMMILMADPMSLEALTLYLYLLTMFVQLGMYCWFGDDIYFQSLEISKACYMSNWYESGPAVRKTLFMLMERSKRPLEIRGLKFFTFSFATFITILKWSYSYFTLLKNHTQESL